MREVAPLYGDDSALPSPTQVCNSATCGTGHPLPCTQDRPCRVKNYTRQEVGLLKWNTADLEE